MKILYTAGFKIKRGTAICRAPTAEERKTQFLCPSAIGYIKHDVEAYDDWIEVDWIDGTKVYRMHHMEECFELLENYQDIDWAQYNEHGYRWK